MKLSKCLLISTCILLLNFNLANATFFANHMSFKGNGTPASEEFAKKCQTVEDERYNLAIQKGKRLDKIVNTTKNRVDDDPIYIELSSKIDSLNQKMIDMKCIKYPVP